MAQIFITGSSDGLGLLAAKKLVDMGHEVVLHARNKARAEYALSKVPNAQEVLIADLSNMEETKKLAGDVNKLGQLRCYNSQCRSIPDVRRINFCR